MNRCSLYRPYSVVLAPLSLAFTICAAALLSTPALAQTALRQFPSAAVRGYLQVTQSPEVLLNGQAARLSPGARLKDANNMLVLPATLSGQRLLVNYVRDGQGLLHEVWILSSAEAREPRTWMEPVTNFRFASESDRPKSDDGKTPFHLLPIYPKQ